MQLDISVSTLWFNHILIVGEGRIGAPHETAKMPSQVLCEVVNFTMQPPSILSKC